MSKSNFYEDVVHQAAQELTDQFDDVVAGARGGERPPFKRELSGQKLREWWQTVLSKHIGRPENIVGVFQRLDRGTQDELRALWGKAQGPTGGDDGFYS